MMTIIILTVFYTYCFFMINSYRKEILLRADSGYSINSKKIKAPYPVKVMVLLSLVSLATNVFLFIVAGNDDTILINTFPVLIFVFILWRYRRTIKKIDKENS